ncbi:hypothetical protein ACWEO2_33230 [Nocardia sp. NPDC004278]
MFGGEGDYREFESFGQAGRGIARSPDESRAGVSEDEACLLTGLIHGLQGPMIRSLTSARQGAAIGTLVERNTRWLKHLRLVGGNEDPRCRHSQ